VDPGGGTARLVPPGLRVVEEQESALELLVGAGWAATLVLVALASVVAAWILSRHPTRDA